jgi:hypothetical protein
MNSEDPRLTNDGLLFAGMFCGGFVEKPRYFFIGNTSQVATGSTGDRIYGGLGGPEVSFV